MYLQSGITFAVPDVRHLIQLQHLHHCLEDRQIQHFYDQCQSIRRLSMEFPDGKQTEKPLTSFSIKDILSPEECAKTRREENVNNHEHNKEDGSNYPHLEYSTQHNHSVIKENPEANAEVGKLTGVRQSPSKIISKTLPSHRHIVRPWSSTPKPSSNCEHPHGVTASRSCLQRSFEKSYKPLQDYVHSDDDEEIDVEGCVEEDSSDYSICSNDKDISPLDALMAMSSKAFVGLENFDHQHNGEHDPHNKSQLPKKKRKTRTAFTNQQIYELEKRFILQKYLTPADRDEIASKLGLTCAQVITWFQNRRAKFKRDIEEMKNDVQVATSPKSDST